MNKKVLIICDDNSALSITAEAILSKYLKELDVSSAGVKKSNAVDKNVKKALEKSLLWNETLKPKNLNELESLDYDLVIALSERATKAYSNLNADATIIHIEYEDVNFENAYQLEELIKMMKMELIPITRNELA